MLNRAVRRAELPANPFSKFDKLKEVPIEKRILTRAEIQCVCRYFAGSLLQTFLLVSLQSGCRLREVAYLLREDVEPESGWLLIRNKMLPDGREFRVKSSAGVRDVWLPAWLMRRLTSLQLAWKPFVWSRHLADIGRAFDAEIDPERFVPFVQHRIVECCESLGIPRFSHHDLRRTQQTWLCEHGWGDAVCLAVAGQNTGAALLRNHYWRPNHRRMTQAAFEDVACISSAAELLEGDPSGDTCGLKDEFECGEIAVSNVG